MSKHKWSAIVYGRSYHVDFRFIALPQDFSVLEKDWAAEYILSTFSQANKLSNNPRWSLFKNKSHCIVGVTCMVRDLLQNMDAEIVDLISKDNRGRPLYVFVGYVTQLDRQKRLFDFPIYAHKNLQSFQELHQYLLEVWQVEEYFKDSKKPILNEYKLIDFHNQEVKIYDTLKIAKQINHQEKYPQQTYLWQNTPEQKQELWVASAICHKPISIYLSDRNIKYVARSPFLNQTVSSHASPLIADCTIKKIERKYFNLEEDKIVSTRKHKRLSHVIKSKVKSDLELTTSHVQIVKNKSQEFLHKISNSNLDRTTYSQVEDRESSFGFKIKSQPKKKLDNEWF